MAKKSYAIGIDLGTANTLVYMHGQGIIYNEPSVVAFDKNSGECIAAGYEANLMIGKEHDKIKIIKPLAGGAIADLEATKSNLEYIFKRIENINVDFKNSTLLICCPSEITSIERDAMKELAMKLGIKDVFVEQEIKAGAIGAGIDIFAPRGAMIVDIGGGTTDIGIISLGDLVLTESVRIAGEHVDKEIIKYVKMKYNIAIGSKTAESIKIQVGTLFRDHADDKECTFAGRHIHTGLPTKCTIKQSEITKILLQAFDTIVNRIKKVLQETPAELAADIFEDGITINGGGALIPGVKEYFEEALSLKVKVAENPLISIVEGTKLLLKNRGNYLVKPMD